MAWVLNMTQKLVINRKMPGINELVAAAKRSAFRRGNSGWNAYSSMKSHWSSIIVKLCKLQNLKHVNGMVILTFVWYEKTRRRDPDNITGAGIKFILDSLVKAEVIDGDGWGIIKSPITHHWVLSKEFQGVVVYIKEA